MRYFVLLFMFLLSCGNNNPKGLRHDSTVQNELIGVLEFKLFDIFSNNYSVKFFNIDNTVFAEIKGQNLLIKNQSFDLKESDENKIKGLFVVKWFYPEYDVLVIDCVGENNDSYKLRIDDRFIFVPKESKYFIFSTYSEFISKKTFQLDKKCPLRHFPNDTSQIIDGYERYTSYQVIDKNGEWVQVKPDKELFGDVDFIGWTRIIKDKKFLVENVYFSY